MGSAKPKTDEIRIGVSACLLGQTVRYDGAHKYDPFVAGTLAEHVTFVPVCPELEIGLGVPRETLLLVRKNGRVHMVGTQSGDDHTATMRLYAASRVRELERLGLNGYVLKKGSPSCGMERVRVYTDEGTPGRAGRGLFAEELVARLSLLPVEEEGRLNDPALRENFIERVFAYRRVRTLFRSRWKPADLMRFQAAEKLLVMAHRPATQQKLGQLASQAGEIERDELAERYRAMFMQALSKPAPRRSHVNVLQHIAGYFKKRLDTDEKAELGEVIDDYRDGLVPLIVPLTLVRHHVRRHRVEYLRGQTYLEPHPKELMLRNHV